MLSSFSTIVKSLVKQLPPQDYPVLNSQLFFKIWLTFILDQSLTSMRDLFYRLNHAGISVDMSTFSKACKSRQDQLFCRIYVKLMEQLKRKNPATALMLMPIDSTIITLTSKLSLICQIRRNPPNPFSFSIRLTKLVSSIGISIILSQVNSKLQQINGCISNLMLFKTCFQA